MTQVPGAPPVLTATAVHKRYSSGTYALRGVDLAVRPGSVHGLIGANGAGKSTLIKILSGAATPSSGTVTLAGSPLRKGSPATARAAGLATVYQHTPLVAPMTVLDNVFLGFGGSTVWNEADRRQRLGALLDRVGYHLDPARPVAELSVGARQMVAILQALARDPKVILLDEPTAALSPGERDVLFRTVRRLRADGTSFVYVSHFLDEVLDLTDRLTVLRDGRVVMDAETAATSKPDLVAAIVGERLGRVEAAVTERSPEPAATGEPLLAVTGLASAGRFGPVSFQVRSGEVVGLVGLLGSGRTELMEAVFGVDRSASGTVQVCGRTLRRRRPHRSVRAGLALVPEDRNRQGLLRDWEIWRNVSLPYLASMSRRRWLPDGAAERALAARAVDDLGIVASSVDTPVAELSGGNAQKVVFAKWIYGPARVFLLDEPSAGVDVGAKADIIGLIRSLAARGHAVVIAASEFEELLSACDRVLVLHRGRITAERRSADTDLHELTALASGLQ